ncbi:MAG: tRNA lysidine(34) synthetase TilS [Candidatus Omnitrophica bacterium]|nr:tRNA lysidine(34) synthetase TilS [Candidatus Omnitrophota bacterium]
MIAKVKETIERYHLLQPHDTVIVAVSGGPDSVALLYALYALRKEYNLTLHVAHLDHQLRKQSVRDAVYVKRLAQKLGLPVTIATCRVGATVDKGSLEEAARNARLAFLCTLSKTIKSDAIALGHTLDDQAETVLMRIIRGAGLNGLLGILPYRVLYGCVIIRPLLKIRRYEIETFLKQNKIKPRLDQSNLTDKYFRNKIRHILLPLLEKKFNHNIKGVLSATAEHIGADYDYLKQVVEKRMKGLKAHSLPLTLVRKAHPALRNMLFRAAIAQLKGDTRSITFTHIQELADLEAHRPLNAVVDLPKGVSVRKQKTRLLFYLRPHRVYR